MTTFNGCMNWTSKEPEVVVGGTTYTGCMNWVTGYFEFDIPSGGQQGLFEEVFDSTETNLESFVVYDGDLYIGTNGNGKLLHWDGATLTEVASVGSSSSILYLVVYNNGTGDKIYGCDNNGKLYQYDPLEPSSSDWIEVAGVFDAQTSIASLLVFDDGGGDAIYGGTSPNSRLFKWNDSNAWTQVATQASGATVISSLVEYKGDLYGGGANSAYLYVWTGAAWAIEANPYLSETTIFDMVSYDDGTGEAIYAGSSSTGYLLKWKTGDPTSWTKISNGAFGDRITTLLVFENEIFGGTQGGMLVKWNGYGGWQRVADNISVAEVNDLAEYNSELYCVTSADGLCLKWI